MKSFDYLYEGVDVRQAVRDTLRDYFIVQHHDSGLGAPVLPKSERTLPSMLKRPYGHMRSFYVDHLSRVEGLAPLGPVPLGDCNTAIRAAGYEPEDLMLDSHDDPPPPADVPVGPLPPPIHRPADPALVARNQQIVRDRVVERLTLAAIGRKYSLTKERVRQILVMYGAGGRLRKH